MRFVLKAEIRAAAFSGEAMMRETTRRARLNFGRFAVARRRPFLAFECLAKTVG